MDHPQPNPQTGPPPREAIANSGKGAGAPTKATAASRRRAQGKTSPLRSSRARTIKRNARRRAKLACTVACGDARIVSQQVDSITRACARDYNGVAIKRQLNGFGSLFALMVEAVALGLRADGTFERQWSHPLARRLATEMIFLGYECRESKFRGQTVWCVEGFSVKAIGTQSTVRFCANAVYDAEGKPKGASINTLSRDIGRLRAGGFLLPEGKPHAHQFDAIKLIRQGKGWAVGPQQRNPDGSLKWRKNDDGSYLLDADGSRIPVHWAFNHYYIPFCPFAPGTRGRVRPGKFDHPFLSDESTGEHPVPMIATTAEGRVEDLKAYARQRTQAALDAKLAKRDAEREAAAPELDAAVEAAHIERLKAPPRRERTPRRPQPRPQPDAERGLWEDPDYMARMMANSDPPDGADS